MVPPIVSACVSSVYSAFEAIPEMFYNNDEGVCEQLPAEEQMCAPPAISPPITDIESIDIADQIAQDTDAWIEAYSNDIDDAMMEAVRPPSQADAYETESMIFDHLGANITDWVNRYGSRIDQHYYSDILDVFGSEAVSAPYQTDFGVAFNRFMEEQIALGFESSSTEFQEHFGEFMARQIAMGESGLSSWEIFDINQELYTSPEAQ